MSRIEDLNNRLFDQQISRYQIIGILGSALVIIIYIVFIVWTLFTAGHFSQAGQLLIYLSIYVLIPVFSLLGYIFIHRFRLIALFFIWLNTIVLNLFALSIILMSAASLLFLPSAILTLIGAIGVTTKKRYSRSTLAGIAGSLIGILMAAGFIANYFIQPKVSYKLYAYLILSLIVAAQVFAIIGYLFFNRIKKLAALFIWSGIIPFLLLFVIGFIFGLYQREKAVSFFLLFFLLLPVVPSLMGAIGMIREASGGS